MILQYLKCKILHYLCRSIIPSNKIKKVKTKFLDLMPVQNKAKSHKACFFVCFALLTFCFYFA